MENVSVQDIDNAIVDRVVQVVNEAITADPSAVRALFENRVPCSNKLAEHLTIQVTTNGDQGYTVGMLGILCGIAGTRAYKDNSNFAKIWAVYNVDCPVHGTLEDESLPVGETCPNDSCEEKLVLGELLRIERVPSAQANE